jgi:hypothetical protein
MTTKNPSSTSGKGQYRALFTHNNELRLRLLYVMGGWAFTFSLLY